MTRWVHPAVRVVLPRSAEPEHVAHLETRVHLPVAQPARGARLETPVAYLASGGVRLIARFAVVRRFLHPLWLLPTVANLEIRCTA